MIQFFSNLTPGQATFLSSIISALIALLVFFITRRFETRKTEQEKYDAVKKYANPIIFASEQLAWRLREILNFNGAYLLPDAPKNGFFKYKFDSTVYRLCAVLGWIQAAKKEQSYISGTRVKDHKRVQTATTSFHKCLADGADVEVSIVNHLADLFGLKLDSINDNDRAFLGVELEKIVFKYIPDSVKKSVANVHPDKQADMLQEIMNLICHKVGHSQIKREVILERRVTAVNEVSREYCWIYRDWQSAIGDEMIERLQGASRRFDVIGYSEFQQKHTDNEWLKKVDNLFSNLDVTIDDRFDSRVKQLKQVFEATLELIVTLQHLVKKQDTISDESLRNLKSFNQKINPPNFKPKKRIRVSYS